MVSPTEYACFGWKYRGLSVCDNTIKVSRQLVESLLLTAIQKDLFNEEGHAILRQEEWPGPWRSGVVVASRTSQGESAPHVVEHELANLLAARRHHRDNQERAGEAVGRAEAAAPADAASGAQGERHLAGIDG